SAVPGEGFDATQIVQYGYVPQYQDPFHVGTFFGAGTDVGADNAAAIPEAWKESWRWWYDGIWGDEPFIPSEPVIQSPDFGAGNPFNSGKIAMAITHMWYTCCIGSAGESWDLGVLPTYNGVVNGRVDADTFRIWKGTENPEAAFEVLSYLIGPASLDLLATYGGMPARESDQDAFFATKSEQYPFVDNWDAIKAGLAYPDIPSGEGYRPNFTEVFDRYRTFGSTLRTTPDLDVDAEIATLEADLTAIMQKAAE
ncbi:MAG: ABC transporter substrate-binding protein, partial [Caldilineaceae bacterium]